MTRGCAAILALAALAAARPGVARADTRIKACVDAYDAHQRHVEAGELLAARDQLYLCGATSCPAVVVKQCVDALPEIDARIPTIVLAVQDEAGHDVTDVGLTLDGAARRTPLDGRELALDPGPHVLRITARGVGSPSEVRIVAREREKGRLVRVTVDVRAARAAAPAAETPVATSAPPPVPTLTYVLGAVGVVALGAFAYFGVSGLSSRSDLDACAPLCSATQRDDARAQLREADVALGVALVSVAAATAIYLLRPRAASASRAPAALLVW